MTRATRQWQLDLGRGDSTDLWEEPCPLQAPPRSGQCPGVHLPGLWDWPLRATLQSLAVGEMTTMWQGWAVGFSSKHLGTQGWGTPALPDQSLSPCAARDRPCWQSLPAPTHSP